MISNKASKQRKNMASVPSHIKGKMLFAHLSGDLRKEYKIRSARICKGDTVIVTRGDHNIKNTESKVIDIHTKVSRVSIDGITINQSDGTATERTIHASNLIITKLNTEDPWRMKSLSKKKEAAKE